jgi:hypothetical protein
MHENKKISAISNAVKTEKKGVFGDSDNEEDFKPIA